LTGIVERHNNDSRERYPRSRLYRSVDELIADDSIQLIIVNTPTHLHYENAKAALTAGKNIVVEKPFAVTVKDAEEITALAREKNLFISIYQNRRYDGDYHAIKDVLEKKLLGELREVEIRYDRYRPIPSGKAHKEGDLPGAGIIYDLSPHLVDQALQLFGWPKAIFGDVWRMREGVKASDYFEMILYYPEMRVRLKATCIAREPLPSYILHGMKGSFIQQLLHYITNRFALHIDIDLLFGRQYFLGKSHFSGNSQSVANVPDNRRASAFRRFSVLKLGTQSILSSASLLVHPIRLHTF
jgi:predicted dehydrogenase